MAITLKQAYDLFLNDRYTFSADKTIIYYKENLTRFLNYVTEYDHTITFLDDLPEDILIKYVKYLRKRHRFEDHPVTPQSNELIKNTTIHTYCRAVKSFLRFCQEEDYLHVNIKIPKLPKSDAEQKIPLYIDEVKQIDATFNLKTKLGLRNYCIVHLMLDAGLRSSEVANLRFRDLLFDKNVLHLEVSKGYKSRVVLMCPKLKQNLYKYAVMYRSYSDDTAEQMANDFFFIGIRDDNPITVNTVKQFFSRLKAKTGIDRLHPHLLRHTFATSYIMGGGNLEMLRILLGHYDYSVTQNYLHLAAQYKLMQADIYRLDPIFFKTAY